MSVRTALSRPITDHPLAAVDMTAMTLVLQEHRQARIDQIEALLCISQTAVDLDIDGHELRQARAALADVESALHRIADRTYA